MEKEQEAQKTSIFALRTTIGQERSTADLVEARAKNFNLPIKAVLVPEGIRGYVLIEAMGRVAAERARIGIKHARGLAFGEAAAIELERFLAPKPPVTSMRVGDIVELMSSPFRGERAKIIRVDEKREEVTVELFEATVPIPVTIKADFVKVIQKERGQSAGT